MPSTMRAYVLHNPGGPDALKLVELPRPEPRAGWVSIAVRAFGLNRSEWFTRRGDSPGVTLPRVLGIECVGEVIANPDGDLKEGQRVAAMMGGMGRQFDGSYAEFTCIPRENVFALETTLNWAQLGALPEMLQTTHGSLHTGLEIERAQNILIRGGTSSIGLAAAALAKAAGLRVASTTRNPDKDALLRRAGADDVLVDQGELAAQAQQVQPGGFDRVLELVGTTTLLDSLQCARRGGIVCMTGILGGQWELETFRPMEHIPTGVKLTSYAGESGDITTSQLQEYVELVATGDLKLQVGPVFRFEKLREAHELMDANRAGGKIVVLTRADDNLEG